MKVGELRGAAYNPRTISKPELEALKRALEVFGDLGGIVFNRKTGNLVGGHQRVKTIDPSWIIERSAAELTEGDHKVGTVGVGFIMTPFGRLAYREVDWDEKIEKAANVAANRHGGDWDDAKLKDLLVAIDDGSGLIELTGFSEVELQGLIDRGAAALPELPSEESKPFRQMTFVVTNEQEAIVTAALKLAARDGFKDTGNENANGNALAKICGAYRG